MDIVKSIEVNFLKKVHHYAAMKTIMLKINKIELIKLH